MAVLPPWLLFADYCRCGLAPVWPVHASNVNVATFFPEFLLRGYRSNESIEVKFPFCQGVWAA